MMAALGPHAMFITGAYALALLIVLALVAWVMLDHRAQRRALADLEARGITRRSGASPRIMSVSQPETAGRRLRLLVLLPLLMFLALAALFFYRLGAGDPARLPSALIGRVAPASDLPALPALTKDGQPVPGLIGADFKGAVTLLNVWASWCVPCHDEAPLLMEMAKDKRFRIAGINYKDQPDNARRFIGRHGNPFDAVGTDPNGRASIDWGVYGVPETFLVGRDGRIAYKLVGPITPENLRGALLPAIEKALAAP